MLCFQRAMHIVVIYLDTLVVDTTCSGTPVKLDKNIKPYVVVLCATQKSRTLTSCLFLTID